MALQTIRHSSRRQVKMRGLIVKGIGGFYYVKTANGVIETRGRGIFRKDGFVLCVGDEVEISLLPHDDTKGVIENVYPRKNAFKRPPIANIDLFLTVFSAKTPKPNYPIIDRFLINAHLCDIPAVICINKSDLITEKEAEAIKSIYDRAYEVVAVSAKTGEGIERLKELLADKKAALAGPSGVGKSSLLMAIHPKAQAQIGAISQKTERGKHTTRHVEIYQVDGGGMIFDTPGFTSFDAPEADEDNLRECYPEMVELQSLCRYDDCRHIKEPGCAVREAVKEGKISPIRYNNYVSYMDELKKRKKY